MGLVKGVTGIAVRPRVADQTGAVSRRGLRSVSPTPIGAVRHGSAVAIAAVDRSVACDTPRGPTGSQ